MTAGSACCQAAIGTPESGGPYALFALSPPGCEEHNQHDDSDERNDGEQHQPRGLAGVVSKLGRTYRSTNNP
jgi:hypothetical protein